MWEFIGGMIGLAARSVMIGWLAAALFWGLTGAAIAAWGRLPVAVGALVGGLLPVVGVLGLAVVAGARRSGELTSGLARQHLSTLPGAPAPSWQQPGWPPGGPNGNPSGYQPGGWPPGGAAPGGPGGFQPGGGWSAGGAAQPGGWQQNPGWPGGMSGGPATGGWPAAPTGSPPSGVPAATRTRGPARSQQLLLAGLGLVALVFASGFVLTWFHIPGSGSYGAFSLPMGFLLVFTLLVLGIAGWLSLHAARRWVAILVAWFSSWWLVIGLAALTATDRFTDLLAKVSSAPTSSGAELGPAAYAVFAAALLGLGWSAAALGLAPAARR